MKFHLYVLWSLLKVMRNPKYKRQLFFLMWICLPVLFSPKFASASMSAETLFNKIKATHKKIFPESFRVKIDAKIIEAQMKVIPKQARMAGKDPYVELLYKRKYPIKIKIRNVEPFYEDALADMEEILFRSGLFFGVNQMHDYKVFSEAYSIDWIPSKQAAKVWEKEGLDGDYGLFYVDKQFKITHAEYFENNEKVAALKIFFKKKTLPNNPASKKLLFIDKVSMWFIEGDEKTQLKISFLEYNLKALPSKWFE